MKKYWRPALGCWLMWLAACTTLEHDLAAEVVDSGTKELKRCEVNGFAYQGLAQDIKKAPLKILMIHGVGTHHPGYSRLLQEKLAAKLGLEVQSRLPKNIYLQNPVAPKVPIGNLRVTLWESLNAQRQMLFYELTWSEITTPYKKIIAFDTTEQYAEFRVPFNNEMKAFLDNVLPDPMIYLVDRHDLILNSSRQALCWMLKTNWQNIPDKQEQICNLSIEQEVKFLADENIVFMTHSLGSEILSDTLMVIADKISDNEVMLRQSYKFSQALAKLQNKEINLFMMANQLPILKIDQPLPRVHNQIRDYCRINGKKYAKRLFKATNFIAFSDPNDILSYSIPQGFADKYIDSRVCPKVTNVSVNVAPEISAFGFGIVNPVTAHTYYERNPKVIDLMTQGTNGFAEDGFLSQQCRWVRLKDDKRL